MYQLAMENVKMALLTFTLEIWGTQVAYVKSSGVHEHLQFHLSVLITMMMLIMSGYYSLLKSGGKLHRIWIPQVCANSFSFTSESWWQWWWDDRMENESMKSGRIPRLAPPHFCLVNVIILNTCTCEILTFNSLSWRTDDDDVQLLLHKCPWNAQWILKSSHYCCSESCIQTCQFPQSC